jgi:predicted acylesterase/phospholipase RssA
MTIKYLVLSGGGAGGYAAYGAVKYLSQSYFNIENVKYIYATSIGALLSVLLSMGYEWKTLDDYIIKRPWDKEFSIKPMNILNILNDKGLFNIDIIKVILKPLLTAKNLSESITLKEFYEFNNVEIHVYTVNINGSLPSKIDFSYKTHPDLELCKAIYMSASLPVIFTPLCDNSGCFIDGGLLNNFPLDDCIVDVKKNGDDMQDILAFKIVQNNIDINISDESEIHIYLYNLINGIRKLASTENSQTDISNIVYCKLDNNNLNFWNNILYDENLRKQTIECGEKCGEEFLRGALYSF